MAKTKTNQTQNLTSRDILFGAINGLIFGALLPVVLKNMNIAISTNMGFVIAIAFTVLAAIGVAIGYFLSKYIKIIFQIAKFGCVGAANFAVDIGILNLLIFLSGTAVGVAYIAFKVISFTFAVTNSYTWNKIWTFKKVDTKETGKEFGQFITISVIGLILNAAVAGFLVIVIGPLGGIKVKTWASVSAAVASVCVMAWNFVGYKFWVFKK
ncbi:MAG: GtrA family protein [Candidatus Moranbacteria bacterium]|nr:GtrA family protein [Candidatus Moranbacteria bacterium]